MMRAAILAACLMGAGMSWAAAQPANLWSEPLELGYTYNFRFYNGQNNRHVVYRTYLPAGVIGIIGVKRVDGDGDVDIEIGTDVRDGSYQRAQLFGVVDNSTNSGNVPDVVAIPPGDGRTYYLHAYLADNKPGKWEVRIRHFDIVEEFISSFAAAALQRGVECVIFGCSSNSGAPSLSEEWVGRALGLGLGAFQSGSVCSFGVRAIANEVQTQLAREYPDSRFLQYGVVNFVSSLGSAFADVTCPR